MLQQSHYHIAIKVSKGACLTDDSEMLARRATELMLHADTYSPGMIRAATYPDLIERVRVEVEANGGTWVLMGPEATMRQPGPAEGKPFVIERIV
jgi:hypothetical protein